jgi:hypothetical protein
MRMWSDFLMYWPIRSFRPEYRWYQSKGSGSLHRSGVGARSNVAGQTTSTAQNAGPTARKAHKSQRLPHKSAKKVDWADNREPEESEAPKQPHSQQFEPTDSTHHSQEARPTRHHDAATRVRVYDVT